LSAVDRIQQLLAHLGRESLLGLAPEPCPSGVVLRLAACSQSQPSSQRVRVP
jgi:hypothetical protein